MLAPAAPLRTASRFAEIDAAAPNLADLSAQYAAIAAAVEGASSVAAALEAFARWDALRREFLTWSKLTELRFRQDTADAGYARAADALNAMRPRVEELDATLKRKLLAGPLRAELSAELGEHAFALWECDVRSSAPAIEDLIVEEARLDNAYTRLLASARFAFRGEDLNLARIAKYGEHPDREVRREAAMRRWGFFAERRETLDRLYDELVHLRDRMARTLGCSNFVELGYRRMQRTDYGAAEVARYREAIARDVVPLAQRIVDSQARAIGVEQIMLWDEGVFEATPPPAPPETVPKVIAAAQRAFDGLSPAIGSFARLMIEKDLLDLESRDNKGGGGFCTAFPAYGLPYVFANLNGTTHDVKVVLHEMGHAFQDYSSRLQPVSDYLWATAEAGEVHSMSMEFLAWPHLEAFFGEDAQRYRLQHLKAAILALPYMAAVDHFQHLVYEAPDASPAERHAFWKAQEARYLPWRRYGGIEHGERGGFWQAQLHIYRFPFYYIDYALALCCALQFWARSQRDAAGALRDYTALCARGGEAPFQALIRSAGLRSPFDDGVLREVMQHAAAFLEPAL